MRGPHTVRKSSPHSRQPEEAGCSKADPTEPKIIFKKKNTASHRDSQNNAIWHLLPQPPHSLPLCRLQPHWTPEISSKSPPSSHLRAFARAVFLCQGYLPFPLHLVNSSSLRSLSKKKKKKSRLLPEASPDALNKVGGGGVVLTVHV